MSFSSPLRLVVPTHTFESEQQVVDHFLRDESATGVMDGVRYLYRGQSREYRRQWPLHDRPFRRLSSDDLVDLSVWERNPPALSLPIPLNPYTLDLPSLIPTDTRSYEHHLRGSQRAHATDEAFDEEMTWFAISVCAFIVGLAASMHGDDTAATWYVTQLEQDFPYLYKLRSIGQHYGMDTGLLDATSSIPVALWFASHSFRTGSFLPRNHSVIYRIDLLELREVERWLMGIPEHEGEFHATSIDIRDTPQNVAPRGYRQQGWSLVGWDHPRLLIAMAATGGLTQFSFPTGDVPSPANELDQDFLVPPLDPLDTLFQKFWTHQPRSLEDAQAWIDRFWNVAASQPIRITETSWRHRLMAEMGRLFSYYLVL